MTVLLRTDVVTADPHGVWSPSLFRLELERAMDSALRRSRAAQTRSERRARRAASRASAPPATVEPHRLPASPSILTEDWFSASVDPDATQADDADENVRQAANLARRFDAETVKMVTGLELEDGYDTVPMRTRDAIDRDADDVAWLHRDEAPARRGFGMTMAEERRAWLMNARLRYADMLGQAVLEYRGHVSLAKANEFPALKAEVQFVRSVQARWRFVDELARHGVHNPDRELVPKLKAALAPTYELATAKLAERRRLAEEGKFDRFRHELARSPGPWASVRERRLSYLGIGAARRMRAATDAGMRTI